MDVYTVIQTIYNYEDGSTDTKFELFETLQDAKIYFDNLKESIIDDYLYSMDYRSMDELMDSEYNDCTDIILNDGMPFFFISGDEYGHDKLTIVKKNILSFKEA